ncbi:MAG: hypothetical protein OCD01_08115 [Fibrobacterales bacterium]
MIGVGGNMEVIDSTRLGQRLAQVSNGGEPIAVVQGNQVIGCFIPCDETMPVQGFPVLDQIGRTKLYEPLRDETTHSLLKGLRYLEYQ